MIGLLAKEAAALVPVHEDEAVKAATDRLTATRTKLGQLEAEEKKLIRIATGLDDQYSDDALREARQQLAIHKGTQTGWYLPGAEQARSEARQAQEAHRQAAAVASARLAKAGEARLIALVKALDAALGPAREIAQRIESLRQELNEGGATPPDHPANALLPDGTLDFQLRNAKTLGWI